MLFRRRNHIAAIATGFLIFFIGTLVALYGTDVSVTRADFFEGNADCSSPENGLCTYGYVCEDGKKGVIGKPCDDVGKVSGKKVTGICVRPGVCEAKEYDGKEAKQPDVAMKLPDTKKEETPQPIQKASFDSGSPAPASDDQKSLMKSLLDRYGDGDTSHSNWDDYFKTDEGRDVMRDISKQTGVPLEFDGETGNFTEQTYQQLQKALKDNVGSLQAPPAGSQYTDESGKPALWQSAGQATGWAEKGVTAGSSPNSWWEKAWEGAKEYLFGAPEELPEGAFPEKSPLWESAIDTASWKQGADPKTAPLKAGLNGRINPVDFAKRAAEKIADSSLNGKAPSYLREFGIKTGSPDEWARLATMLCQQESGCRVAPVNSDGSLQKFPTTPQGEKSYGPLQFDKGQYGLKTWSEVNDPDRVIDAFIRVAERDKLLAYFGSMQRPQETLQHSSWYDSKIAPYVGNVAPSQSIMSSVSLNQNSVNWSAYTPLDLSYSLAPPQLAAGAQEFEVPGPYAPALAREYDIPGPYVPALITEYQTGEYDIPTFYADNASPEPVPTYSDGGEFTGQPEPDAEHFQAGQLVQGAVDWAKEKYQSLNDGLQALWEQEISQRMAGDFNMADYEWPLAQKEESFVQQEAINAAEAERQADRAKWQAAYKDLVNTYQDPIGDFSENSVTAEDVARAYDDSVRAREDDAARVNDPNSLTPSQGVPPAVAVYEEGLTEGQKNALDKAISDAQKNEMPIAQAEPPAEQKEPAVVEAKEPRGAHAKTLAEWYRANDKQLTSKEQRAADYDASASGCGSGAYRGTACQNAWLLSRYQKEAWADAYAVAASSARGPYEPQGNLQFDKNLPPVENGPRNLDVAAPVENTMAINETPSVFESLRDSARNAYGVVADSAQSAWNSAREWWNNYEQTPSESGALGDASEPESVVGDYAPQAFTENDVVQNDARAVPVPETLNETPAVAESEYAASNKESLTKEDSLAVQDMVEDAEADAVMEKEEAAKAAAPAQPAVSPAAQQAANNLLAARQRLSNANSALAQAFRDARDGNVDVGRITTAMNNLTASRDALQAAYRLASRSGGFTSGELSSINNSIQSVSSLVGEVSSYRPYLGLLNQSAVQQYWPRISALVNQGSTVVASLNRSINAPAVMGYTRRGR